MVRLGKPTAIVSILPNFSTAFRQIHGVARAVRGNTRLVPLMGAVLALWSHSPAFAASGSRLPVTFDAQPVVACRDVSTEEFLAASPGEKMFEARIAVSSLVRHGSEDDLIQFMYQFETSRTGTRIVDYAPQTTLASDQAGNVSIENKDEDTNHAGISLSAPYDWPLKASGSGDLGTKSTDTTRYELVPDMFPVAASGTIRRGYGVYFKLRPSRSTTLEGSKTFTLTLRVPETWRGGYVRLTCTALGVRRGVVSQLDDKTELGSRRFNIALHREGDAQAKLASERLIRAEWDLVQAVAAHRRVLDNSRYPTIAHRFAAILDVSGGNRSVDWAQQLIYAPSQSKLDQLGAKLPRELCETIRQYQQARRELSELGAAIATAHPGSEPSIR